MSTTIVEKNEEGGAVVMYRTDQGRKAWRITVGEGFIYAEYRFGDEGQWYIEGSIDIADMEAAGAIAAALLDRADGTTNE